MSRSFRDLLKFSAPLFVSAALLSGCGSGSSGSADLDEGGSTTAPPPPVTKTESFDFKSPVDWFVSGTPPIHARFSGGTPTDTGTGYWIIPSGKTGVIDFGTPADAVKFSTKDKFVPSAAAAAQKTGVGAGTAAEKPANPPFDDPSTCCYIRGLGKDWTPRPDRKLVEVSPNILEVTLPLDTTIVSNGVSGDSDETGEFKIGSPNWQPNCGTGPDPRITVGVPYEFFCASGDPEKIELTITEAGNYKFRVDVSGSTADAAKGILTITKVTNGGGGDGDGETPPEDSTIIRIHSVTVVASAAGPAGVESVKEVKGLGSLTVDELRKGGEARITRIEIENTGTNGDIGVADISWTADAQFALEPMSTVIYYSRPTGSTAGTKIVVGGETYDCVAEPADSPYDCVAQDVEVTPYANAPMAIKNADGSTETITFNGGSGDEEIYAYSGSAWASTGIPASPPAVSKAAAHWVTAGTLLFDPPSGTTKVELLVSPDASIGSGPDSFVGTFQTIPLTSGTNPKPPFNNQLHNMKAWSLPATATANAKTIARGQLVAVARDTKGNVLAATLVQTAGAIDDLYAAAAGAQLGVTYASGAPTLAVWAPTALKTPGVSVNIYDDAADTTAENHPMTLDEDTGVWSVTGTSDWNRKFYTISLKVYSYAADAIVTNDEVTDPYSVSLAMDSKRSQFVNLEDADLKPSGWDTLVPPALDAPEDAVVYELHVRDFSIADSSVPEADRGKFTAFDAQGTNGRAHLQKLAQAGLTHVHILPAFDIASVKENPADQVNLNDPVEKLCAANSEAASANLCVTDAGKTIRQAIQDAIAVGWLDRPQQIENWMRDVDAFNWGYDPYHFGVPEGSYSTDPNGVKRIYEFRRMVKGLNDLGLRTVMDVVYNHTSESGQNAKSVLDKIVPGYYYRRDKSSGAVTTGSCCQDTASEFRMMEKLMVDTGTMWVKEYKVSGFRVDLMGLHPLSVMTNFKDAVKAIDSSVYVYGEGWNCCGTEDEQRFHAASQPNLGGTGIGSFSDRIRDPIRGGGAFDSGTQYVKNQGFISGWYYDPNSENTGSVDERKALIADTDNIRVWLAGGLKDYQLQNSVGSMVAGKDVNYKNQLFNKKPFGSGYTNDPQEAINYIDKHDNQTLWDYSEYKHPTGTPIADRVRAQNVGQSLILLGQGVPFMQAGSDILRSKSGDRNSYNSGDWFNELDWTLSGTKWAQGLPISGENSGEWSILQSKYQDVTTYPGPANLQRAFDHVREMLQIRKSSPLFRLRDADQVNTRVKFLNTGPSQIPGVIAMEIDGCTEPNQPVPDKGAYMAIFNASDEPQTLALFGTETWTLHPVLVNSTDPIVKTAKHDANGFYVPARTTAVFYRATQTSCQPFARTLFVRGLGPNSDWSASPANQLIYKGGTRYEAYLTGVAAGPDEFGFKIADNDYNDGTNCGVSNQSVAFGVPLTLVCRPPGNGNIGFTAPTAGNYLFRLDAVDVAAPQLTVINSPFAREIYVRGLGAGSDWSASPAARLEKPGHSSVYQVLLDVAAGPDEYGFKIADNDYNDGTNCGSTTALTIGQPLALACQGPGNENIQVNFPSAGVYSFSLDATVPSAPKLTVQKPPYSRNLFIRGLGAGSDWSASLNSRLEYKGGTVYEAFQTVAAGADEYGLKIADNDPPNGYNDGTNCGATTALTIGQALTLACTGPGNENIQVTFPSAGIYRFRLDAANPAAPQLTVTGP